MADQTRIFELALKGLEAERTRIDEEIADIRQRLGGGGAGAAASTAQPRARGRRGRLSAAGRRRISEMMKARWAERRRQAGTTSPAAAKTAKAKRNRLSPAGRRAISEAMKLRWAARRKNKK